MRKKQKRNLSGLLSRVSIRGIARVSFAAVLTLTAGNLAMAAQDIIDCDDPYETDIAAILWNVANEYDDFEDFVEDHTGVNLKSCFRNPSSLHFLLLLSVCRQSIATRS